MSKNIKRTTKDNKDGVTISVIEASEGLEKYRSKKKEILEFELKSFLISITILISTSVYIHKTVINFNLRILTITISKFCC
jgi:hypothetical protein